MSTINAHKCDVCGKLKPANVEMDGWIWFNPRSIVRIDVRKVEANLEHVRSTKCLNVVLRLE